jgi:hypothetical protein
MRRRNEGALGHLIGERSPVLSLEVEHDVEVLVAASKVFGYAIQAVLG